MILHREIANDPPKPPLLPRIVDRIGVRMVHLHIIQFDQQTARLGRHHEVLHVKRMQRRYVVIGPAMQEGGRYLLGAAHDASIAIRIGALAGDQEVSCAEIDWFLLPNWNMLVASSYGWHRRRR